MPCRRVQENVFSKKNNRNPFKNTGVCAYFLVKLQTCGVQLYHKMIFSKGFGHIFSAIVPTFFGNVGKTYFQTTYSWLLDEVWKKLILYVTSKLKGFFLTINFMKSWSTYICHELILNSCFYIYNFGQNIFNKVKKSRRVWQG